ncbi:LacI family DNA-binding transcriptional regulator [Corynebacterium sp. c6VSa_13]|uniref:LacI family DNA-binding transcriptional regulator n=1 Tax=Corynebacterium sp. c6VSa_13 TaxID=2913496 RepID=UPI0022BA4663|nr:LacI family DNA-binding transcriptional regulator [Corynebacterium sp. c6VSa_13]MCZ9309811.1 LacI family DNA-binding transcriptional regulator [Corynebacterium sp. c6VSa_13]
MDSQRPGQSRGTLASLAAELGVSRTTVSNAYNHPDQLSAATRARILAAAAARGYPGPDPVARSLRTRRAGAIGVVLTEHLSYAFDDAASVDFLSGVAEACSDSATALTLIPVGPEGTGETNTDLINAAAVDGFVVYSVASDDAALKAVLARGVPTVICGQPKTVPGVPFVGIDDRAAIAPAARTLIDAGHRNIGILAIRLEDTPLNGPLDPGRLPRAHLHIQRDRILGALGVFAGAGIDPAGVPVVTRHLNTPATARDAAAELLESHPELTAVACTTDSMALGVLAYAREQGLRVPEDLSVTGFDGIAAARAVGLVTVEQPNRDKGIRAVQALEDTAGDPVHTILPTRLLAGRSVAAPAR